MEPGVYAVWSYLTNAIVTHLRPLFVTICFAVRRNGFELATVALAIVQNNMTAARLVNIGKNAT